MVRILYVLLLILIIPIAHSNNTYLQLEANDTRVEIGQPLHITITASNLDKNLTLINLDVLMKDFGVYVIESSNKPGNNNQDIQELKISLYPRHTGTIEIPPVTLSTHHTESLMVTVLPALENNKAIHFETSISSTSVWQRQQVIITTKVYTHSKFAKIELDDFTHQGIKSYKLEYSREQLSDGRFLLTSGWILYPLISGKYNINLAAVNYRLKGKVQRKFIPQNVQLNVSALPSYIPPLLPVGKIIIDKRLIENTNQPRASHILSVHISSPSALPSSLPNLPRDYLLNQDIIAEEALSSLTINLKNNTFHSFVHHQLPISFNSSGNYHFPELVYNYFDPHTGKIIATKDLSQSIIILSTPIKIILLILVSLISIKALSMATNYISHLLKLRKIRKHITSATLTATSPHELHQLLNEYAKTYNWGDNMTLNDLQVIWPNNRNKITSAILQILSNACYSKNGGSHTQQELNKKIYRLLVY